MGSESQPTDATCAGPNTSWVCADRVGLYTASEMKLAVRRANAMHETIGLTPEQVGKALVCRRSRHQRRRATLRSAGRRWSPGRCPCAPTPFGARCTWGRRRIRAGACGRRQCRRRDPRHGARGAAPGMQSGLPARRRLRAAGSSTSLDGRSGTCVATPVPSVDQLRAAGCPCACGTARAAARERAGVAS